MVLGDTIAAIATAPGEGAIGVVRVSGPEARAILQRIFRPRRPGGLVAFRMRLGEIVAPEGEVVDEVLAVFMPGPASYTREDVVEIQGHGGWLPLRRILELVLALGARPAGPGEFTRRAFLNGRLDLVQAEAVLDVVRAKTEAGLSAAVGQLEGRVSQRVGESRDRLLGLLAAMTAAVDFPDEVMDPGPQELLREMDFLLERLAADLEEARRGGILREGLRLVICGKPNVGKSSLLNALVRAERAIVTDVPGTTRDAVEEMVNVGGLPVRVIDTAGVRETQDAVEMIGVGRAQELIQQADVVLVVVDVSQPLEAADHRVWLLASCRPRVLVMNKVDLVEGPVLDQVREVFGVPAVAVSARTRAGMADLEAMVAEMVWGGKVAVGRQGIITSARHRAALAKCQEHLRHARDSVVAGLPLDITSLEVKLALEAMDGITGAVADDELLDRVFADFCVGK
ncbi:MAG: tRNA uridine-5-carboxymethylaminomethyl(34) synthesis GTPase MnmE [Clostridia bacterium]|nr:MAG: tRNA uridine-5-carboxymethylaminomethyl(34) synthesis GTPase MnmE [Clostridia bacterium]